MDYIDPFVVLSMHLQGLKCGYCAFTMGITKYVRSSLLEKLHHLS